MSIGRHTPALWLVFFAALLVRVAWVYHAAEPPRADDGLAFAFPDEKEYWRLARSLGAGHGLVDEFGYRATYMPLYPWLLSLVASPDSVLRARLLQAIIGAAAVFPIYWLARRLADERAAAIAAALTAFDPFLVFGFCHLLLTETVFTTLLCAAIALSWPATRRPWLSAVLGGFAFAAAIYTRPSVAGLAVLWPPAAALLADRRRRASVASICAVAVTLGLLLPWAARNRHVTGQWIWLTTRGGISLYDGLGPKADGGSNLAYTKTMPGVQRLGETQWNEFFYRESLRIAREDPARVARLAWAKLKRTWSFVPNEPSSRMPVKMAVSFGWMAMVVSTAVVGFLFSKRRSRLAPLLIPAAYFTLLHMVYVGSVRYRVPAMPPIYVLSALALAPQKKAGARSAGANPVGENHE